MNKIVKEREQFSGSADILNQTRFCENLYSQVHAELSRLAKLTPQTTIRDLQDLYASSAAAKVEQLKLDKSSAASRMEHLAKRVSEAQEFNLAIQATEQLRLDRERIVGKQALLKQSLQQQLDKRRAIASSIEKVKQKTIVRIERGNSKNITKALQGSPQLAEQQLLTTTDDLSTVLAKPEADQVVSSPRALILSETKQDELTAIIEVHEEDKISLAQHCSGTKASNKARLVLQLVNQCNGVTKIANKQVIFKPTTRLMEVYTDFQSLLPSNQRTFTEFVDCLYFIFYEGAGAYNLRFLTECGGALEREECEFIWCIKQLRNKWLRHDPDHGKESKNQKSWQSLATNLSWLGLNHFPISEQDFRNLHDCLLHKAEYFLKAMLEKMIEAEYSQF